MKLAVIAHNIRSTHNIGAILRTSDGFGVEHVYVSGYSPYPEVPNDSRLPHLREKLTAQIHKTALGAEKTVSCSFHDSIEQLLKDLRADGYKIAALEQSADSITLPDFTDRPEKLVLLLGEEVHGIEPSLLELCDIILEIPMSGKKESFNVSVAAGIALYELSTK